jgi:uncharacterized damage-inducible protein DinB
MLKGARAVLVEHCEAFFKAICLTLNHIAYSGMAFLSLFTGDPSAAPLLDQELFGGFDALRAERAGLDKRLLDRASTLSGDWLNLSLTYASKVNGWNRHSLHGSVQ